MNNPYTPVSAAAPFAMDAMIWHCVQAMLVPLWVPVKDTAPVTSFNWAASIKAVQAKEARPSFNADVMNEQARRVQAQAYRMALEHRRTQECLAKKEAARQQRDEERRRQAQHDTDAIGEFEL
jgi:hypothetical protein